MLVDRRDDPEDGSPFSATLYSIPSDSSSSVAGSHTPTDSVGRDARVPRCSRGFRSVADSPATWILSARAQCLHRLNTQAA